MDDVAGPALGNGWTTVGRKGREVADQALHLMLPAPGRPGWLRCAGPYQPGLGWSGHRRCRSRLHGLRFCWRERTIGGHTYVPLDVDVLLPCRDTLGSRRAQAEARLSIFGVYCVDLELRTGTASAAHQRVRSRRRLGGGVRGLRANADRRRLRSSPYGSDLGENPSNRYAFHIAGVPAHSASGTQRQRDHPDEGRASLQDDMKRKSNKK